LEYWLEFWWVFPIALAICIAVCTVGISGAVLFVPFFSLAFPALGIPLAPVQAVQVGLFTEIFGFASSTSAFWRNGLIDFRLASFALLFAVPLAVTGGLLAHALPGHLILLLVSVVMLLFSFLLFRAPGEDTGEPGVVDANEAGQAQGQTSIAAGQVVHRDRRDRVYRYRRGNDPLRAGAMAIGGLFQGLVGFSIGEIAIVEQALRGVPMRLAVGTTHVVIAGSAIAAGASHATAVFGQGGALPWNLLAMTVPAVLLGGQMAGWLAGRVSQDALRRFLALFLIALALLTGIRALAGGGLQAAAWILLAALLLLLSVVAVSLWKRRRPTFSCCYNSCDYYCPRPPR
jgi:uncharacterized membrane protein YfcA